MSTFLYLTVDGALIDLDPKRLAARANALVPGIDRDIRVVKRVFSGIACFELFAKGVALATTPHRRRSQVIRNLTAVALAALESGGRVGLSLTEADAELSAPLSGECITPAEALDRFTHGEFRWFELDLGIVNFVVRKVEARFWSPQTIADSARLAAGFFVDYSVLAHSCDEMRRLIQDSLEHRGASPLNIPAPEVSAISEGGVVGVQQLGGLVMFP